MLPEIHTIKDSYPELDEPQLAIAKENLERYAALTLRIFERLELEAGPQPEPLAPPIGTLSCDSPASESSV